jgi:Domain of unknown function (DUF4157)
LVFGHGSFDPASLQGRQRLAHELVHVQQQRHGPVSVTDTGVGVRVSDPADPFEREAEATATRVMASPGLATRGDAHDQDRPPGYPSDFPRSLRRAAPNLRVIMPN